MEKNDIFQGLGVEVKLETPEDFLKICETLQRIGIASFKTKTLWQSCHLLHKQGRYAIVHFKEMFAFDNKSTDYSQEDEARRNNISLMLEEWGLLTVLQKNVKYTENVPLKVISHKEKTQWNLVQKYQIGNRK